MWSLCFYQFLIKILLKIFCASGIQRTEGKTGVSPSGKHMPGFSVANCERFVGKPTPRHALLPCFHFPQEWREIKCLSGTTCQIEHLLSICITSLCLSPTFLQVPPTTDCFFSPPQIPSFSTKLCLFWCCRWSDAGLRPSCSCHRQSFGIYPHRFKFRPGECCNSVGNCTYSSLL